MKQLVKITLGLLASAYLFCSCNKVDVWTCECTLQGIKTTIGTYPEMSKKDAKKRCEKNEQEGFEKCKVY